MSLRGAANFFIISISIVVILIFGQSLIIPFVFALLLWFIVREIRFFLDRSKFIKDKLPSWSKSLIASLFILVILSFTSQIITSSINSLAKSYSQYEGNVDNLLDQLNDVLDMDIVETMKDHSGDFDFGSILSSIFDSLTNILGNTFMIIIYALFIFLEESSFATKLKGVFEDQASYERAIGIINRIDGSIAKYLKLKTFVSLITGFLSYIALLIIGVESAVFWAFLIFLLNYIPTIGSLIGTVFPAIFCLLQFGEFTPGLMVLVFVGAIQVLVGNVLEPRLMGNSMNISSLVTIIALSFWGAIWGITGMILSIPITVIIVIILSQFPSGRAVAILLSDKGLVEEVS